MKYLALILLALTTTIASAQHSSEISNAITIDNHGGYDLSLKVGVNKGDLTVLWVECDHSIGGTCLVNPPTMGGQAFTIKKNEYQAQMYEINAPYRGDLTIGATYWYIGTNVHYHIVIDVIESH